MERELYEWQEKCLERWEANGGRGMVQAVTGSGKTLLALTAMERLDRKLGGRLLVRIVVPTATLMLQWNKELREHLEASQRVCSRRDLSQKDISEGEAVRGREYYEEGPDGCGKGELSGKIPNPQALIGLRGGGYKGVQECKYMIYVINSARYELARQILARLRSGDAVLLVADECHHYESGQNRLIFEFLPYVKECRGRFFSMGLSATLPSGQGERYLASVLGRRIYSYGMAEASKLRTVCRYDVYHIGLSFLEDERMEYEELSESMNLLFRRLLGSYPMLERMELKERYELLRSLAGDKSKRLAETAAGYMGLSYKRKNLVCLAAARVGCVVDLVERLGRDERVIVFGERIRQADELYGLLQERYPGRVGRCHSKMGQQANKNALERFRLGETRILIACKALDEGMDIPEVAVGIILSGTSAQRQRIQRLGRIIRRKEGKEGAALYYLHMAESSEDACFLPEGGNRIFELEYDSEVSRFFRPDYDDTAEEVLERLQNKGADERTLKEACRCLELGCVRSDWLLGRREIDQRIKETKDVRDRNYWICMKRLAAVREEEQAAFAASE